MLGLQGHEIVVVRDFPAGFAARIETRIALGTLAMQCQEAESLALVLCRLLAPGGYPVLENFFAGP